MPIVCLAKVSPLDPATGNRVDLYLSSADDSRVTGLNGLVWEPALTAAPSLSINLWQGDFQEPVDTGGASFGFNIGILKMTYANADTYMWAGAPVEIYAEEPGTAWPWAQRFKGRVAGFSRRNQVVTINSKIDTEPFEKNVLTATYAGTTGAEGSADLKGRLKPLVIGWAKNVEPVLIDATNSVYQFSAYGAIEAVSVLYERATDFGASVGDYATYAALVAATIPAGRWATCLAAGMVRLGAPAAGVITGDIRGHRVGGTTPRLTGAVISALATIAGVSAGNIESATLTALDAAVPYPINIVLTEQAKFNDIAASLALACNWQSGITLQGKFFTLAVTLTGSEVLTLNAQGSALPQVTSSDEQDVSVPYYQTIFGAGRNWRVQSADEIAFTAQLIERGTYNGAETYREGNIVTTDDGARWLYINTTAGSGNAPPTLPTTSNAYWSNMTEASPVAVLGFLTNESHNVFADSAGTVASWTGAGGTFVVQENGVTLSSGITFSLVSATGVTVSINATSGVYAATAMSANTGTATLRAVYNGVTIDKIFSISKTIQGTTGAAGSNTSSVLLYQRTTTGSAPAVVTTGSATYTFATGAITGQPSGWTPSIPSSGGGFLWVIRAVASASAATDTIANTEWSAPVLQSQDGAPGSPGAAATSAYLTNESVQLFAYANGNVVSYSGASGDFKVFAGSSDISASFALSTQSNPQALTIGYSGQTYSVTAGFDAGEDTATVTIRATGSGAYAGVTFDKVLSLSKAKGGYEIVAALPSTNLFSGRVVFNEVDDKLYRYTGTAWTAAVPAADVAGQLLEEQLANGIVSESKLKIGVGSNMLIGAIPGLNPNRYIGVGWNPDGVAFYAGGEGGVFLSPAYGSYFPSGYASWTTPDGGTFGVWQPNNTPNSGTSGTTNLTDFHFKFPNNPSGNESSLWPVEANKFYEFSAYTGAHRCTVWLIIEWLDANGVSLGTASISGPNAHAAEGGIILDSYTRLIARGQAPATARNARLIARKSHTYAGGADSWMFLTHPMWAETTANATQAMPYNPPPAAILNAEMLVSNSILTRHLRADTIESQHLKANIVSAKHLFIGDNENLLANGNLNTGNLDGWSRRIISNAGNLLEVRTDTSWPARYGLFMRRNSGNGELSIVAHSSNWDDAMAQGVTLRPGEELYFECVSWTSNTSTSGLADVVIKHPNGSITQITPIALSNTYLIGGYLGWNPGPNFTTIKGVFKNNTSNTGTTFLRLLHDNNAAAGSEIYVWNTLLRKRAAGELIVDGGILARHVGAGEITTDKLGAGAITAAKVAASNVITLSAQINDAIITNAKIGDLQVNTLKIANNAVTIGVSAYGSTDVDVPQTNKIWYDVQSLTISTSGGPVILLGQVDFWAFAGWCYPTLRIVRGSTVLKNALPTGASESTGADSVIMFVDTPAASTHTYKLQVTNEEGAALCRARNRFLFALETKK